MTKRQLQINTAYLDEMDEAELRAYTMSYFKKYLKGKKIAIDKINNIFIVRESGKKIAIGSDMYPPKAAIIEHFEELIKNSKYNNWGKPKEKHKKSVLGFLNFKSKITINGKKEHVRISVVVYKKTRIKNLKSYDVGRKDLYNIKKPAYGTRRCNNDPRNTISGLDGKVTNKNDNNKTLSGMKKLTRKEMIANLTRIRAKGFRARSLSGVFGESTLDEKEEACTEIGREQTTKEDMKLLNEAQRAKAKYDENRDYDKSIQKEYEKEWALQNEVPF